MNSDTIDVISMLSTYRRERVLELLSYLYSNLQVVAVLLGGSLSYKESCSKSDVDLFCLIQDNEGESMLKNNLATFQEVDTVIFQGFFPWTQNLYTIFYKQDIDFTIDLCLVEMTVAKSFFWEPDGVVVFDKEGLIESYRNSQMSSANYAKQPFLKQNPFSLSIITLKKIEKNLSRKHIWNALEQLNILRGYIMQIFRLNIIEDRSFLGRVDRDIEDVLPEEINIRLAKTIANYDFVDIATKTILMIDILGSLFKELNGGSEKEFEIWFSKQLQYEKDKISAYTCINQHT